ncbi:bromodomain and WD repeat-containing protein 3-like [Limulus polyphemus]|uniref:Bromodomain and WD repeat-containing protein 3-like n=1 Tax=Limulus polyphemus TaxID=6850 RepID=A0ABM1B840_LIMPO|nr:bromodomain and WD repeat-containing protein 3-like [Limulus polyphemus]
MSGLTKKTKKTSSLEAELYYLIAKFLNTGPCRKSAEILRQEIEEYQLMPCRIDWLGNYHQRSFEDLEQSYPHISHDHLLKICSRLGPVLDKEVPSSVPGVQTLLGAGRQSLLRTKQNALTATWRVSEMTARRHGCPFLPPSYTRSLYPPNIVYGLYAREASGPMKCIHLASSKMYAKQQLYRRMLGHLSSVYCVLFDRTGKYIFTGADDTLVKIWSAWDGRLLSSLRGHSAEITDMAVTYDNSLIAASSVDKIIRVWCLRTTAPVAVLTGHTGMVTSLQFCPYPKGSLHYLISTGNDGCVCFWQWSTKTTIFNPKPLKFTERNRAGAQMICSSFSSGGIFLATGSTDHHVRVYNILGNSEPEKIMELEFHSDRVDSLQFSHIGCRFITGSKDGTALVWWYERQKWNTTCLKMTAKLPGVPPDEGEDTKLKLKVTMVGWSLDDSLVITAVNDHSLKVWDSYTGTLKHILNCHEDEVFVLETHPTDTRILLSAGHDGRIVLWDIISGVVIKSFFNTIEGQGHGAVFDCKFSFDGLMFASTDSHGHISIFGLGSNERYKKVPEEQFFHTDYRPLIRDSNQHVLDEQTQCAPHLMPPPFLVDIDGNPYPPHLQRLVPGRENCNESQLIPYIAVLAEGQAEILEPIRPVENDQQRRTIDEMIERLQQQQNVRRVNPPGTPGGGGRENDRNAQGPLSPRLLVQRSLSGHSRVGMRRNGDIEGVRQSSGNWQSRGQFSGGPSWLKKVVVKPMSFQQVHQHERVRQAAADHELAHFNREKRKKPIRDVQEEETDSLKIRRQRRSTRKQQQQQNTRTRSVRELTRNNRYAEDFENPEEISISSSNPSESSDEDGRTWADSSSGEAGTDSPEHSDWTADVGVSLDSSRKKTRTLRYQSNEEDDEGEEETQAKEEEERKERKRKQNKRRNRKIKEVPEEYKPPEWLTDVIPHKTPYVPQVGDEVVYFRQGHELYIKAVRKGKIYDISLKNQPFRKHNLREQELVRVEDIKYEIRPPRLCHLQLVMIDPETGDPTGESFTLKYHDMADVIDFLVLRYYYNQAMERHWKAADRFRCIIDDAWWLGRIDHQEPLQEEYPDCMFQCFFVMWDNQEMERMSPWDFEPLDLSRLPDEQGGSIDVTDDERLAMKYVPKPSEWPKCGQDQECDRLARGLEQVIELAIAEPFMVPVDLNRYPVYALVVEYPIDLSTIKARLENRFYRRLEAVKFDVKFIEKNAKKFNEPKSHIVKQANIITEVLLRFIETSDCTDPMLLYQEIMEARQTQSLLSESDDDDVTTSDTEDEENGEEDQSAEIKYHEKRRKKSLENKPTKRKRLQSRECTSSTWIKQCLDLIELIFECEDSTPFRQPVDQSEYPDYRDIIDHPMDLSTVKNKLQTGSYGSPVEFCKDMRLIFQNSRNYNTNKRSKIYGMTIRLSAMFEEHIRGIVSDWRSAVKYEEKVRNNQYVSNRRKPLQLSIADWSHPSGNHPALRSALTSSQGRQEPSSVAASHSRWVAEGEASSSNGGEGTSKKKKGSQILKEGEKKKLEENSQINFTSKIIEENTSTSKDFLGKHISNGVVKKKRSLRSSADTSRRESPVSIDAHDSDRDQSEDENLPSSSKKMERNKNVYVPPNNDHRYHKQDISNESLKNRSDLTDEDHRKSKRRKSAKNKVDKCESSCNVNQRDTSGSESEKQPSSSASKRMLSRKRKHFSDSKTSQDGNTSEDRVSRRAMKKANLHLDEDSQSDEEESDGEITLKLPKGSQRNIKNISKNLKTEHWDEMTSTEEESEDEPRDKNYFGKRKKFNKIIQSEDSLSSEEDDCRTENSKIVGKSVKELRPLNKSSKNYNESRQMCKDKLRGSNSQKSNPELSRYNVRILRNPTQSKNAFSDDSSDKDSSDSESTSDSSESSESSSDCSSDSESESRTSESQELSNSKGYSSARKKSGIRRSSRTATRNSTRATRSALTPSQSLEAPSRRSRRIQTRNKKVHYQEDSEQEYESSQTNESIDSQVREALSVSSRGRVRKLSRHARAMIAE